MYVSGQVTSVFKLRPGCSSPSVTAPPPIAYCATYLCVAKQLRISHSPSPVSTATVIHSGRQTTLPAHPLIQWAEHQHSHQTVSSQWPPVSDLRAEFRRGQDPELFRGFTPVLQQFINKYRFILISEQLLVPASQFWNWWNKIEDCKMETMDYIDSSWSIKIKRGGTNNYILNQLKMSGNSR